MWCFGIRRGIQLQTIALPTELSPDWLLPEAPSVNLYHLGPSTGLRKRDAASAYVQAEVEAEAMFGQSSAVHDLRPARKASHRAALAGSKSGERMNRVSRCAGRRKALVDIDEMIIT